ncbi:MAG: hypothetical protein WCA35_24205 [Kovacikia sp.]
MSQSTPTQPFLNSRHLALASLKRLPVGRRLNFDQDTYVLRSEERYVAYRNWMSIVPLVEIFYPNQEQGLIQWLEQHGYTFN